LVGGGGGGVANLDLLCQLLVGEGQSLFVVVELVFGLVGPWKESPPRLTGRTKAVVRSRVLQQAHLPTAHTR
jgi:hypothetical protein